MDFSKDSLIREATVGILLWEAGILCHEWEQEAEEGLLKHGAGERYNYAEQTCFPFHASDASGKSKRHSRTLASISSSTVWLAFFWSSFCLCGVDVMLSKSYSMSHLKGVGVRITI